ncbi:hypothetical protein CRG98_039723 [Punica granatum]|uniref:RING-type E3 ubiquitin transferase n=1 Tax=Punica granatum TaxID=22663 RepID=A0A2I0I7W2_PUNGR|nr:hypothetical protein CRG98_039723 [Punica granatum]
MSYLSPKGAIGVHEGPVETAIAVDTDKNSQSAMKWAVENLLKKNPNCVLIHVMTQSMRPNEADFVPKEGRPPTEAELKQFFLPFRGYCARKGIFAKEMILHDIDIPSALVDYVITHSISHLVIGHSSRNSLLRKFSASDVGKILLKSAPDSCSVYIVAKDKLQAVRHAKTASQSTCSAVSTPNSSSSDPTNTLLLGVPRSPVQTVVPDTYDVTRSSSSIGSWISMGSDSLCSGKSSDSMPLGSYNWQNTGLPMAMRPTESYISKSSHSSSSELSDFSLSLSFQSSDMSFGTSSSSGHSCAFLSSQVSGNMEAEMAKLQLEFKESLSVYNTACQDAATAAQKASDVQRMKMSQLRSSEEGRPPKENMWSTSTDIEMMKKRNSLMGNEMVPKAGHEIDGDRRYSAPAYNKNSELQRKKQGPGPSPRINVCYRRYTVDQIEEATDHFSSSQKIGEGGYGPVYKGTLDHTPVAIKALRANVSQGIKQFHQEIEVLSCMRHPNMVILVGACPEYGCLVYEYLDNGNLEDRLFCKDGTPPIPWQTRFKIAAEIATCLAFLHHTKPEPMVHRDIKPSNILLDRNYVSKISDVGLARLVPGAMANTMTQYHMTAAAGTFCYIDPEYQQTGMLGVKSDVYSLGVLLLQIITAKSPMGLAMQVEDAIEGGTFPMILDQTITDWPLEETLSLAKLALKCCELRKRDRPDLASDILPELVRLNNLGLENGTGKMVNATAALQKQQPEEIEIGSPPSRVSR